MTTVAERRRAIPLSYLVLGILALVGIGLLIYRFVVGLAPTTNLSDEYPWGLWITMDLFLIPIGGAAFTTSLIGHFFRDRRYHRVVRPAVLIGFLCYSLVGIILLADLGRSTRERAATTRCCPQSMCRSRPLWNAHRAVASSPWPR